MHVWHSIPTLPPLRVRELWRCFLLLYGVLGEDSCPAGDEGQLCAKDGWIRLDKIRSGWVRLDYDQAVGSWVRLGGIEQYSEAYIW